MILYVSILILGAKKATYMLVNKKLSLLLLLCIQALLFSGVQAKEMIFLLAGQSNMVGQGNLSELAPNYRRPPRNVTFYFNGYQTPLNRFRHFGPEIGFAHELARHYPHDQIKLIKFAVGGTSLFAWDPNWNPSKANSTRNASAGPLFKKLLKTARIQFDGDHSRLAGIIWMQGETDAKYPSAAKQYAGNLSRFVNTLRSELQSPNAPFIMGSINPPLKLFPSTPVVQRAQQFAASRIRNLRLIKTGDLSKRNDHLHYNTNGQLELGKRFARAFIKSHVAQKRFELAKTTIQ